MKLVDAYQVTFSFLDSTNGNGSYVVNLMVKGDKIYMSGMKDTRGYFSRTTISKGDLVYSGTKISKGDLVYNGTKIFLIDKYFTMFFEKISSKYTSHHVTVCVNKVRINPDDSLFR